MAKKKQVEYVIEKQNEQEFVEVSQEEVKRALRTLTSKRNETLGMLYKYHEDYNKEYFEGKLSVPLITIDKMNNKTLATYTPGKNNLEIENHFRFNRNFIALNEDERILETLKHEMIHQWQDEILYLKPKEDAKTLLYPITEPTGNKDKEYKFQDKWEETDQKKRPKDWHNKHFKEMASVVDIIARGEHCYGSPAKMPEVKSYNRKFICGCIASNGHPVTMWSTRDIDATCNRCKVKLIEVPKGGKLIKVEQSHVEQKGQDAVKIEMEAKGYNQFERFKTKDEKDAYTDDLKVADIDCEDGIYQRKHNSYTEGFRYWVAYNSDKKVQKKKAKPGTKAKKQAPKAVKKPKPKATKQLSMTNRKVDNPKDLIAVYNVAGSIAGVAEKFKVDKKVVMDNIRKFGVNFSEGTFNKGAKA